MNIKLVYNIKGNIYCLHIRLHMRKSHRDSKFLRESRKILGCHTPAGIINCVIETNAALGRPNVHVALEQVAWSSAFWFYSNSKRA